jgi:membrane fusion protein (multidrug efflux system)
MKSDVKKKGFTRYVPLILVIAAVMVGAGFWYKEYARYLSTDDAHVDTDMVSVSSKILGRISHLYVDEGDVVKQGQLVAELDSTDLLSQRNQALAMKNQASASVLQAEAKYKFDRVSINILNVNLERAREDLDRAKAQFSGGVITQEQFDHFKKAYEAVNAQLEAANNQLNVSRALIASAESTVEYAAAQVQVTETQLRNTRLTAPFDGVVGKRWLLPGDITQPGQAILTLTDSRNLWVSVFIEETKVTRIHVGQPVRFTLDAVPGVVFTGKVTSIGANTAGQFSLIPASNASGNFTKVTQRVPIKVSIEGTENQTDPKSYNLLSGMSVSVKIIKQGK